MYQFQICVGLNNIERVRSELVRLPALFHVDDLLYNISTRGYGGDEASGQIKATVEKLISSATENMEAKVVEFTETVVNKVSNLTCSLLVKMFFFSNYCYF